MTLPPHSASAEYAVLGGILDNNICLDRVDELISEADFYDAINGAVFEACRSLIRSGQTANYITVFETLAGHEGVAKQGGEDWLASLIEYGCVPIEAADMAMIIAEASQKRRLMSAARDLLAGAEGDLEAALEAHESALQAIRERQGAGQDVESAADGADDLFAATAADALIPSGFESLDKEIGGFERGAVSIIAARPGVGKTAVSIVIAAHMARRETVGFVSLDMQGKVIRQRLANYLYWQTGARAPMVSDLKKPGVVPAATQAAISDCLRGTIGDRFLVTDRGNQTVRTVSAQIRAWKRHCAKRGLPPLGAVFIDHIAKVAPVQKVGSLYEKTSFASNELLDVAKQHPGIALIQLCQLNRETEKVTRRPLISDLRDSGKIEEDASMVLLLHREDMRWSLAAKNAALDPEERAKAQRELLRCKGDLEIIIGKNRNGEQGAVKLWHNIGANAVRDLRSDVEEAVI